MLTANQFFSDEIASALGWTLVNITWQGFLIALLLGLFLKVFKKFSSQVRYVVAFSSLLMVIGVSAVNFIQHYEPLNHLTEVEASLKTDSAFLLNDINALVFNNGASELGSNYFLKLTQNIDKYFPVLINLWLAGILIFILKFLTGLIYFQKLKRRNILAINKSWIERFSVIEEKLSLHKKVEYLESAIIKIPVVWGYLKPLVLVPAGMLTGIPENQIEAIIAHELAHIKRNDYLINILQSIIEVIFFFHPAVWYISSTIRNERENCCDDIALTACEGSLTYVKALVSVQELYPEKVYSAVAFAGKKKQLLNRIKRMIMKPKMESNYSDRIVAILIVFVGLVVATLSVSLKAESSESAALDNNKVYTSSLSIPSFSETSVISPKSVVKTILKDTTKVKHKGDQIIITNNIVKRDFTDKNGKRKEMEFTLKNGSVSELFVDGKKVPESEYNNYQPQIDETIDDIKDAKEDIKKAMQEIAEVDVEKIKQEVEEAMKEVNIDMAKVQQEIANALEESKKHKLEEVMKDVQMDLEKMKKIDFEDELIEIHNHIDEIGSINLEEIKQQMEEVRMQLEKIDVNELMAQMEKEKEHIFSEEELKEIQEEMFRAQEEISKLDFEKIRIEMDENFKKIDKEKITKDMEEELKKLEGLELEEK